MAATKRLNKELSAKMAKLKNTTDDPIEKLRASCLEHGAHGIAGLGRFELYPTVEVTQFRVLVFYLTMTHGLRYVC